MSLIWKLLNRAQLSERREDGRISVRDLDVFYFTGSKQKRSKVKDMSATGVYLHTDERWQPGTCVLLTLQRTGFMGQRAGAPVRLRAKSVRIADDGVGLTFVPEPLNAVAWRGLMTTAATLNKRLPHAQEDVVGQFRIAKALAFLIRICPSAEAPMLKLITETMSDERAIRAIEMALKAEELIEAQPAPAANLVSQEVFLRTVEVGSEAKDELMRQSWAGMLASFCLATDKSSNQRHMDLLVQLLPGHVQILNLACTRAWQLGWGPGFVFPEDILCPANYLRQLTGIRDLAGVEQDLNHLHHLGLLEPTARANAFEHIADANITPTGLGLKLFARCRGQAEPPEAPDAKTLQMAS